MYRKRWNVAMLALAGLVMLLSLRSIIQSYSSTVPLTKQTVTQSQIWGWKMTANWTELDVDITNKENASKVESTSSAVTYTSETTTSSPLVSVSSTHKNMTREIEKAIEAIAVEPHAVIVNIPNWSRVEQLCRRFFSPDYSICQQMLATVSMAEFQQTSKVNHTLMNVTFMSQELFSKSGFGTGNYMMAFYAMRLGARTMGNIDISIKIPDAKRRKSELILPWMAGFFPRTFPVSPVEERKTPTVTEVCGFYRRIPTGYMIDDIRYEMRRMAIAMVGIPHPDHPSVAFAEKYLYSGEGNPNGNLYHLPDPQRGEKPRFPGVELDDAAIHFRCGDIFNLNRPSSFGFIKFSGFSKYISSEAKTIGIVTQPFGKSNFSRKRDRNGKEARCRQIVIGLVGHLKERFPNATISIRNHPNETITLAYARLVMANQTLVAMSSFGLFAALASFGTGYARKPDHTSFLLDQQASTIDHLVLAEEPALMANIAYGWWGRDGKKVMDWFRNDSILVDYKQGIK